MSVTTTCTGVPQSAISRRACTPFMTCGPRTQVMTGDLVGTLRYMAVGFFFASRAPVALTVAIAIFFEIFTGYVIRDNLTLNVIMLIWPVEAIKTWQSAL